MTEFAYLIPLLQLLSFVMIIFFLRWKEKVSSGLAVTMSVAAWVMSVWVLIETICKYIGAHGAHVEPFEITYYLTVFPKINLEIGILVDALTAMMLLVVSTIGACVQIYSLGYMRGDKYFSRFFAYLSLFLFSMFGLVLANNFFMIFIFWELVGLTSYLLIGFYFEKKSASDAGKKAFITNRIGDLGFIIGLLLIGTYAGTFNYREVFDAVSGGVFPPEVLVVAAIGLFCGAIGKSAQFPLHVWLPDAMEGPTPVSALIHAATMVVAGVYLVARGMDIFVGSADAAFVVAAIGLITSFMAATIALTQNDIKRVLAYSTVSQLGYMIMALGLYGYDTANGIHSPGYYAGTFHLMTHAFFKGLLFLAAGSVIHAVHTNDIREMGGLLKKMPKTGWTFLVASASISGVPLTAGFFSKDEIVAAAAHHPVFYFFTLLIAFMTAFYMWRLCFMTFFGKPRDAEKFDHAHESPATMTGPLVFLGVLAVIGGWVGIPGMTGFSEFVFHGEPYHTHVDWVNILIASSVGLGGIYLAWLMYLKKAISADKIAQTFRPLYLMSLNKWWFDELYDIVFIRPILTLGRFLWTFDARVIDGLVNGVAWFTLFWAEMKQLFDTYVIDGAVNGSGWLVSNLGQALRYLQTGRVQFYTLFIVLMIIVLATFRMLPTGTWLLWTLTFLCAALLLGLIGRRTVTNTAHTESEKQA
ncbi:MAG: NADH-quinone oxidoreductase subunit L [candidate division Zixibacteria bacterium]|nr:NADH-quinone oxidoreductase subunit L [candidate division Zixibacteria bacterium]